MRRKERKLQRNRIMKIFGHNQTASDNFSIDGAVLLMSKMKHYFCDGITTSLSVTKYMVPTWNGVYNCNETPFLYTEWKKKTGLKEKESRFQLNIRQKFLKNLTFAFLDFESTENVKDIFKLSNVLRNKIWSCAP